MLISSPKSSRTVEGPADILQDLSRRAVCHIRVTPVDKLACLQVRVKAMEALGAARVLDKGLAACRAMETGMSLIVTIGTKIRRTAAWGLVPFGHQIVPHGMGGQLMVCSACPLHFMSSGFSMADMPSPHAPAPLLAPTTSSLFVKPCACCQLIAKHSFIANHAINHHITRRRAATWPTGPCMRWMSWGAAADAGQPLMLCTGKRPSSEPCKQGVTGDGSGGLQASGRAATRPPGWCM